MRQTAVMSATHNRHAKAPADSQQQQQHVPQLGGPASQQRGSCSNERDLIDLQQRWSPVHPQAPGTGGTSVIAAGLPPC